MKQLTRKEMIINAFKMINKRLFGEAEYYKQETSLAVEQIFDTTNNSAYPLTQNQLLVLRERLGINDDMMPRTQKEIGERLHIAQQSVSEMEHIATRILVKRIKRSKDCLMINEIGFSEDVQKFIFNNPEFQSFTDYLSISPEDERKECIEIREKVLAYVENHGSYGEISLSIDELDLSVRTSNRLRRAGIGTIGELLIKTSEEVSSVRGMDGRAHRETVSKVHLYGYQFADEIKKQIHGETAHQLTKVYSASKKSPVA